MKTTKIRAPRKPKRAARQVPCQRVVVGGKAQSAKTEGDCAVMTVPSKRLGVNAFDHARGLKARFNLDKPCYSKRKACPVQLAFEDGQPFLRFCAVTGAPGRKGFRVDVNSPDEAMKTASSYCSEWEKNGQKFDRVFPKNHPLGRGKR